MKVCLLAPFLILGGCNVSTDSNNDQMTVQYDQQTAQNVASDAGNTAEGIGRAIANDVDETAAKVNNSDIVADDGKNQSRSNDGNRE